MSYVGDVRAILHRLLPDCDEDLLDLYSLLVFVKGENVTLEDVHDAWALWRHRTEPDHHSIIPFGELANEVQELDRKYAEAIRWAARFRCMGTPACSCECEGCRHHCGAHMGIPCRHHQKAPAAGGRCGLCRTGTGK